MQFAAKASRNISNRRGGVKRKNAVLAMAWRVRRVRTVSISSDPFGLPVTITFKARRAPVR